MCFIPSLFKDQYHGSWHGSSQPWDRNGIITANYKLTLSLHSGLPGNSIFLLQGDEFSGHTSCSLLFSSWYANIMSGIESRSEAVKMESTPRKAKEKDSMRLDPNDISETLSGLLIRWERWTLVHFSHCTLRCCYYR